MTTAFVLPSVLIGSPFRCCLPWAGANPSGGAGPFRASGVRALPPPGGAESHPTAFPEITVEAVYRAVLGFCMASFPPRSENRPGGGTRICDLPDRGEYGGALGAVSAVPNGGTRWKCREKKRKWANEEDRVARRRGGGGRRRGGRRCRAGAGGDRRGGGVHHRVREAPPLPRPGLGQLPPAAGDRARPGQPDRLRRADARGADLLRAGGRGRPGRRLARPAQRDVQLLGGLSRAGSAALSPAPRNRRPDRAEHRWKKDERRRSVLWRKAGFRG